MFYRITFSDNSIDSLQPMAGQYNLEDSDYFYSQREGSLVFAIVRADSEEHARKLGLEILKKLAPAKS